MEIFRAHLSCPSTLNQGTQRKDVTFGVSYQTHNQNSGVLRFTVSVKNVNPSTPRVYPNQRFHLITTPDANTYCGCGSAVTYFSAMSNKGTCSTPTPKCTSDSFFSLQTPQSTEQVNKNQGRHTAEKEHGNQTSPKAKGRSGYCFTCPR